MLIPTRPRVCVIGAGISGLVTAKVLRGDGFAVTVFEKHHNWGGVWTLDRAYPHLRANNPKSTYAFSDHPYPAAADTFPTAQQVRNYLTSYIERFGLHNMIRLNTAVTDISRDRSGRDVFHVTTQATNTSALPVRHEFDFAVVCNGTCSEPFVPDIPGSFDFRGTIEHSSGISDAARFEGKDVIVLGAGKSALDCAALAAAVARSATLVYRRPHWSIPRYLFGAVRVDYLVMTRLFECFLSYHRQSAFEAWLHRQGRPLVRLWWNILGGLVQRAVGIPRELQPGTPLHSGFGNTGVGGEFYALLRDGRLTARQSTKLRFVGDTLELDSGESIQAEFVIAATGWNPSENLLAPELQRLVQVDGKYHLYRHILPPRERRLGFVGYTSSTASQLTSEISAHWLSQCFRGELMLPEVDSMDREILAVQQWTARVLPERPHEQYVGPHLGHYLDELMRDMGLATHRAGNFLSEYCAPIAAGRYRGVTAERYAQRNTVALRHAGASAPGSNHENSQYRCATPIPDPVEPCAFGESVEHRE